MKHENAWTQTELKCNSMLFAIYIFFYSFHLFFFFFFTWKLFSVSRSGAVADALVSGRVGILIKVFGCLLKLYAMHGFLWGIMMKAELNH